MEYLNEAQKEMELAKTMVQNGMYSNVDDALKEIQSKKSQEPSMPEEKDEYSMVKRIAKVEQVLQDFGKYFVEYKTATEKTMKDIGHSMMDLKNELDQLKTKAPTLKEEAKEEPTLKEEIEKAEENNEPKKEEEIKEPEKKETYNERQGEFTPDDVQIEDIFSNAHGKMIKN